MSHILPLFAQAFSLAFGLTYFEDKYVNHHNDKAETTTIVSSPYNGITPLLWTVFHFWTIYHGFVVVGRARGKYSQLAKEDGEEQVDERYLLPNLYVQGTSKHAKAFNCIQRSHQHIFETLSQMITFSFIGWINYPISSSIITSIYMIGRVHLSNGYAQSDGDPKKRYSSKLSGFMFRGLIAGTFLAGISSVKMLTNKIMNIK